MAASNSMNDYIDKAVERYSLLFMLPSKSNVLMYLFTTCLFNGILIVLSFHPLSHYGLALGFALGTTLFCITILSDYLIHFSSIKNDPVLKLKRCLALSFYSLLFWLIFIFAGSLINFLYTNFWFKFFILGFCAALVLRLLVFSAVSFAGVGRVSAYALLLPVLNTILVVSIASAISSFRLTASFVIFFLLSIVTVLVTVFIFIFYINRLGVKALGIDSFAILKAFLANWTEDMNTPFEEIFDRIGQERNIQLSALSFRNSKQIIKAMLIIPAFHPGPFKNVGSSALPYTIQTALENKMQHCIVSVPHGLSGHDLDIATQAQNQLILDKIFTLSNVSDFSSFATPLVRIKRNGAAVSCQVFNGCALVTLTLAPETMEDLPLELNTFITEEARKCKFSTAIAIDAHNSIEGPFKINEAIKLLQEAAVESLHKASENKPINFQIGAARVIPKEFNLQDGMGPSGITAFVVRVCSQTTAYITIDGNNMISGLREKILLALTEIGVNEGEVFTTDTHMVNAVDLSSRGYHPIGEVMNQEKLIKNVKQVVVAALNDLEPVEAAWKTEKVPNVKVIGGKQIEAMCMLVDAAAKRAKKMGLLMLLILVIIFGALIVFI